MPDVYIGEAWNREMPIREEDYRECPECPAGDRWVKVCITAYDDVEYWTCPRGHHTEHVPEHGRYGTRVRYSKSHTEDPVRAVYDFKRNEERRYLTAKRRREMGLEDPEENETKGR